MSQLVNKKQLKPSLIFESAETSYVQYIYSGNLLTDVITWKDNTLVQKVQEENYSYLSNRVSIITTKQYDRTGVLIETLTEVLSYTGNNVTINNKILS